MGEASLAARMQARPENCGKLSQVNTHLSEIGRGIGRNHNRKKMDQTLSSASAVSSVHRYFSWRSSAEGPPLEFPNGAVWDDRLVPEWRYPLSVLSYVQRKMPATALRFYFTKNPYELPEYGNDVVAVLWQEERCKIPTYARHVRGVIHCCLQVKPFLGFHPRLGLNRFEAVLTFQYLRDWALHLRSRYHVRQVPKNWPPALHDSPRVLAIPLGYHSQEELPQIPMAERQLDAFFTGQLSISPSSHELSILDDRLQDSGSQTTVGRSASTQEGPRVAY